MNRIMACAPLTLRILLLFLPCLLALHGCASLPSAEKDIRRASARTAGPPEVVGPSGKLSPAQSKNVMKRLENQTDATRILQHYVSVMEELSGKPLTVGNRVDLLIDSPAAYAAMLQAIENARDHINLETFIFADDESGKKFADALLKKSAEGVQVNIIYDSMGSLDTQVELFQRLQDGGVRTLAFNPIDSLEVSEEELKLIERDHRKILVVDGKVAFTGGMNIGHDYSESIYGEYGGQDGRAIWRDTHIRITGPAVAEFQKLFLETWREQNGPELGPANWFPTLKKEGDDLVHVIGSTPGVDNRTTYTMYVAAITYAENYVHLTNAYFVPGHEIIDALVNAARRGVDVRIILPGVSDSELVFSAGRSYYSMLLKAGVKIYERGGSVLHAKTAVVDGVWATVGSTNLDLWSLLRDNEVNAIIIGADFSDQMEAMFQNDLRDSKQITPAQWAKRPWWQQVKEWFARLFEYLALVGC